MALQPRCARPRACASATTHMRMRPQPRSKNIVGMIIIVTWLYNNWLINALKKATPYWNSQLPKNTTYCKTSNHCWSKGWRSWSLIITGKSSSDRDSERGEGAEGVGDGERVSELLVSVGASVGAAFVSGLSNEYWGGGDGSTAACRRKRRGGRKRWTVILCNQSGKFCDSGWLP